MDKLAPGPAVPHRAGGRPFVGRAPELVELRAGLDETAEGRGALFLLSGEPGIGKTRLMQELSREAAERGWRTAAGRCWEEGGAPVYWPWIQAVRALGGDFEQLAGATPDSVDPETTRFRLFDAVAEFLVETARKRPLIIVLDDLHAADAGSLVMLRFVSEAVSDAPVLIVGSYREREAQLPERAESFAGLVRVATRVSLQGLSADEVGAYLGDVTGDQASPDLVARIHVLTGGNPFFLGEVVRVVAHDPMGRIPEELRTLLRRRMADLPDDAVEALHVAAVVGREFNLRVLERTSELGVARLLDVLADAEAAGVVAEDPATPRRYAFVHELVRETLYDDLAAAKRLELHGTIGGVLEELYRNDLDPHLSEIANHLALAAPLGDVSRAVDYLVRAGDRAASLVAYEEAGRHYERALGLVGASEEASRELRCELLLRLGDAHWRAGDTRAARGSFEQAAEVARRLGDGEMLARAALGYVIGLGGFLLFARFEAGATGIGLLEEALGALPAEDSPLRARVLARLAVEMYSSHEGERRLAVSAEAIEMSRRLGDSEALVTALHAQHWARGDPEMVYERLENAEEMLAVAEQLGDQEFAFLAHNCRLSCLLELCDGAGLDAEIAAIADLADRIHQPFYRWHGVCLKVIRAVLDGRFDDAERLAQEALRIARLRHSEYAAYVYEHAQLVAIRWAQGRFDEYWPEVAYHGERYLWIPRWREALAAAESGDRAAAALELARAGHGFAEIPRDGFWLLRLCSLAEACVLVGDRADAERLYDLLLPYADRNAIALTQVPFGPVALRLGMLAALLERWDEAETHFEAALERCELLGARAMRPRVLREYARGLVRRTGEGDSARAAALHAEADRLSGDVGIVSRAPAPGGAAGGALRPRGRVLGYRLRRAVAAVARRQGPALHRLPARRTRARGPRARAGGRRRRSSPSGRDRRRRPPRGQRDGFRSAARPPGQGGVPRPARGPSRRVRRGARLRRRRARRAHRAGDRRLGRGARARRGARWKGSPDGFAGGAGAGERDEGDQDGHQAGGAGVADARGAPDRLDPHRPLLLVRATRCGAATLAHLTAQLFRADSRL